ncbi:uncharacterized protein [Henckelia pumila]|uniref:uncharacterized protein n=1 Tax=Henckelia pumila TaxID=405737 RepID=UPI003C6E7B5E
MTELKPILGQKQWIRINETPFANWVDIPKLAVSSRRVDFILNRFQIESCSLTVGDGIMIPFSPEEFSIILGLHHIGQPVDLDLRMDSIFVARQFGGQVGKAKRATIYKKLISLAGSDDDLEVDDFVRLYILFIFNSIIFSTGNYFTPSFIFPYLDNLTTFFEYAWGDAAFRFIQREIRKTGSKTYFDGCTVGLMAWVYERMPSLGVRRSLEMFPRLFRWMDSKIPLNEEKAELLLKSIDSTKVLPIYPFPEEKKLDVLKVADGTTDVVRSEVVRKKFVVSNNRMCFELGCGSVRRRRKTKIVIEKEMMDVGAEFKLQSKNEVGFVTKEDDPIERNDGHENTETNEENENMKRDENFERNVEDDNIENSQGNVHIFRNEDEENIEKNEKEMIEAVGNSSEIGSSNDHDNYSDLNLVVQNIINEIKNDVGFDKNDGTVEERKSVSCVGTSKAEIMTSFQSSIMDTVRTRVDRKKKRKASIFVTPPSSSPRPKRKGQKRCIRLKEKCIVDVDENAKSPMKDDLHEFKVS